MYCSSCGAAVPPGLSFCNHCGARLSAKAESKSSEVRPELLVAAMVALFVFGLPGITFLVFMMKEAGDFDRSLILIFMGLSFLLMFSVEAVLIWLLLRRKKSVGDVAEAKKVETKELEGSNAKALPESMPSVTEHTTRTFAPIYNERESS